MWYNIPITWLLRSPFHGLLDNSVILITVQGRKSGKSYTTPVNYIKRDDALWVVSQRDRTWWRNLRGGAAVKVQFRGLSFPGQGEAIEAIDAVVDQLGAYLRAAPKIAQYLNVNLDESGQPSVEDLCKAAENRVMVKITLH